MWISPENHLVVGQALEAARDSAGLTQVELAKILKKPQSFVSSYESGQRRIDLLEFAHIVETLGADPKVISAKIFASLKKRSATKSRRSSD